MVFNGVPQKPPDWVVRLFLVDLYILVAFRFPLRVFLKPPTTWVYRAPQNGNSHLVATNPDIPVRSPRDVARERGGGCGRAHREARGRPRGVPGRRRAAAPNCALRVPGPGDWTALGAPLGGKTKPCWGVRPESPKLVGLKVPSKTETLTGTQIHKHTQTHRPTDTRKTREGFRVLGLGSPETVDHQTFALVLGCHCDTKGLAIKGMAQALAVALYVEGLWASCRT